MQGKSKQAKGNAIERLGKNVIGFRAALLKEAIFPFVCFGDGCDFADDSSIVDRVKTIAMFGTLNEIHYIMRGLTECLIAAHIISGSRSGPNRKCIVVH